MLILTLRKCLRKAITATTTSSNNNTIIPISDVAARSCKDNENNFMRCQRLVYRLLVVVLLILGVLDKANDAQWQMLFVVVVVIVVAC